MSPTTYSSFAVVLHNHTQRIMRRYKYDVRGGISVPPELITPPKDMGSSKSSPGTILVTSDNSSDSGDSDDDLDFLKCGPKAKLVYHWNDEDGTYKVEINYNEKDGFNADLSGPDERRFKIKVNQSGAENTGLHSSPNSRDPPPSPRHSMGHNRSYSSGSSDNSKTGNRASKSFAKNGNRLSKLFKSHDAISKASGVAFLSVTVERVGEEELKRLQAEEDEDAILESLAKNSISTVVEVD